MAQRRLEVRAWMESHGWGCWAIMTMEAVIIFDMI